MEFIVSRNSLLRALQHVRCAITKQEIQVFKHFVFSFDKEKELMTVHASNGSVWMEEKVVLDERPVEPRPIAIYYSDIINPMKSLDEQPLRFEVLEYQVIVHHSIGSFRLPLYQNASEFFDFKAPAPDVEAHDGWLLEYEAPCLKSVLSRCNFAMAQDDLRPVMNGVYVNLTDQFSDYVSSDGHKLVRVRKDPVYSGSSVVSTSFILPSAVVKTLLKVTPSTGDIDLEYQKELIKEHTRTDKDGNGRTVKEKYPVTERRPQCRIVIDDTLTISFNPIEGKYPKYWSVIPETHVFKMTVDRKALIKSCDRLSIFANQSDLVEMRIDESTLKLKSENADFEVAADEQLPCVSEPFDGHSPINLRIGMNAVSVSQTLKTISTEKAVFLLSDHSRAAIIQPQPQPDNEEITMLLMPMLIND